MATYRRELKVVDDTLGAAIVFRFEVEMSYGVADLEIGAARETLDSLERAARVTVAAAQKGDVAVMFHAPRLIVDKLREVQAEMERARDN